MGRIRILLAEMPRMLRDVFTQVVSEQPDMTIVGGTTDGVGLLLTVGDTRADVVIVGLHDSELPGICSHLFEEYPHLKVLGVTQDRQRAFLYQLRPEKVPVGEAVPHGLLSAIRAAVGGQDT